MKLCRRCEKEKDEEEFPKFHLGNNEHRRRNICKRCTSISQTCRRYGITLEEYHQIFEENEGRCQICGEKSAGDRNHAIDHCHTTGEVRGLLCGHCNQGLGHFKDDSELLEKAILYLASDG